MDQKVSIVKIGGNIINDDIALSQCLKIFAALEESKILVHGGGKLASEYATRLGVPTKMIKGRRITDAETLKIITMIYAGTINKNIVAQLQGLDINAIGLTGADANIIQSNKRPVGKIDYGFVGDVQKVNGKTLLSFLQNGLTPILSPITHNRKGQLLNTNADTIAAETAIALSKHLDVTLYYCFEKRGVLKDINDDTSIIESITMDTYQELKSEGIVADGMIPKLDNCMHALSQGVNQVHIGMIDMLLSPKVPRTTLTLR